MKTTKRPIYSDMLSQTKERCQSINAAVTSTSIVYMQTKGTQMLVS